MLVPVLVLTLLMLAYSPQSGVWLLTVQTDRPYYTLGDRVYISGRLTYNGGPDRGVLVAVAVKTPTGATYFMGSSTTDDDGKYIASTTLSGPNAILGQYNVTATASPGTSITSWTTFPLIDRIYINANGDVSPSSAPISRSGDTYRLTGNITGNLVDGIVIGKGGIILDGAGYTLSGMNILNSNGISLVAVSNTVIENITVTCFSNGISETSCSNDTIIDTSLSSNSNGIHLQGSDYNIVEGNSISTNAYAGIFLEASNNNNISKNRLANTIASNHIGGIRLEYSRDNNIVDNNLTQNTWYGVYLSSSYSNHIFHNNFVNNTIQAYVDSYSSGNVWNDGYPSGGNYWNDYRGVDNFCGPHQNETGSDGVGDTPYNMAFNNKDNYPLMGAWNPTCAPTVHLLLTVDPDETTYERSQSVTLRVNVLNQLNPPLSSALTLTVTGPGDYYYFDFQSINVTANAVGEYSFAWNIPDAGGTYVIEVSIVPPQLTAYDVAWLEVA